MRYCCLVLLVLLLGCKDFKTQEKISSKTIVEEEMKQVNWKEVEVYPTFESCKNTIEKQQLKQCFEEKISAEIYQSLSKKDFFVTDSINEKVWLHISISAEGKPQIDSTKISTNITQQLPEFGEWLVASVKSLPKIYPARKRGIPVKTSFKLPLTIVAD